jgi:hypothetical protein
MRALRWLSVCWLPLFLSSCAQKPQDSIIGQWRSVEKPLIRFTFRADGTFRYQAITKEDGKITKYDKEYEGKYRVIGGKQLELETYPGGQPSTSRFKISFERNGTLKITNGEDETTQFEKVENE